MAEAVTVLYFLQGEHGESEHTPNAFVIPRPNGKALAFGHFLSAFPLHLQGQFVFRFRAPDSVCGYIWEDISDPEQMLPQYDNVIAAKVLRISALATRPLVSRLRRKLPAFFKPNYTSTGPAASSAPPATPPGPVDSAKPTLAPKPAPEPAVPESKSQPPQQRSHQVLQKQTSESLIYFERESPRAPGPDVPGAAGSAGRPAVPIIPTEQIDIDDDNPTEETSRTSAIRRRAEEATQLQKDTDEAKARLGPRLSQWAEDNGKKRNIRTLLITMHEVLWADAKWRPLSLVDVIDPAKVKLTYRKAMLVVHPDRTTGTNADQQFAGKRIFEAINEAYAYFLEHESP